MKKIEVDNQTLGEAIIEVLNQGQQASFTVRGSSMMPFFRDGKTIVTIKKKDTYQKGDIIFFRYQGQLRLHRIIKIKNEDIIASGDHLRTHEKLWIKDIEGYVVSFQRGKNTIQTSSILYRVQAYVWRVIKPIYLGVRRR